MSHHLDNLTATIDPRLDITDLYVFRGTTGTVFVLGTDPGGRDGFHPEAVYEIKCDINGDGREDVTFRTTFDSPGRRGRQEATLRLLTGPDAGDRDAEGTVVARTKTEKTTTGDGGIRMWAGTAGDPFYIEPTVIQAVSTAVAEGRALDLTGFDPRQAKNKFADANVQAIVIEVPDRFFRGLTIGCWGATAVPTDAGDGWRQTDRAGIPLVSTLFGLTDTDDYAATQPAVDDTTWGHLLQDKTAKVVAANSPGVDVEEYAQRVRGMLLPEILPYRIGTEARFVHGRRNGRNLRENVAEDMYQLVLRRRVETGLTSDAATGSFRDDFPYLSQPV